MGYGLEFWVQLATSCISLSALLLLVALGLTFILGISGVMNFAHGSLYALGAYLGYTLAKIGINFWIVLLISPTLMIAVGVIIERVLIGPIMKRGGHYALIMTFGIMVFIDGLTKYIWGNTSLALEAPAYINQTINFAGISYPLYRVFMIIMAAATGACLLVLLQRTKLGLAMRAASRLPVMVAILGINMKLLFGFVFGLGCFLAGIGGVIAAPLLTVYPMMGIDMLVNCFIVVVIGGLGSLKGTFWAALLVGTVQTLGYVFITDWAMVVVFIMMIFILLFFPKGILGEGRSA
jgi:branched-chain amino acid transport system permease protein